MITLFSARGCPYAQRARAALAQMGTQFELREIDLQNKPADFLAISPTGRVPLMVDGTFKLYESFVIIQYLAEKYGFEQGWSTDPALRARQRLAVLQWDAVISPAFMKSLKETKYERNDAAERELDELQVTTRETGGGPSLLAFALAPFWVRMRWVGDEAPFVARIAERRGLAKWLDAAVALGPIQQTLPDRDETVRMYRERFGPRR